MASRVFTWLLARLPQRYIGLTGTTGRSLCGTLVKVSRHIYTEARMCTHSLSYTRCAYCSTQLSLFSSQTPRTPLLRMLLLPCLLPAAAAASSACLMFAAAAAAAASSACSMFAAAAAAEEVESRPLTDTSVRKRVTADAT